jgi:hypothetical protein
MDHELPRHSPIRTIFVLRSWQERGLAVRDGKRAAASILVRSDHLARLLALTLWRYGQNEHPASARDRLCFRSLDSRTAAWRVEVVNRRAANGMIGGFWLA